MQDYYAARAPEYDAIYLKPERQADLRSIEAWLPPMFAGRRVLEVACGTGYWTRFIAPVAASVLAIDAAPETLRIAEARVRAGDVRFQVGDAYALAPCEPACDAAFAGFWFSHVPRARAREFLAGLNGALAPGATVSCSTTASSRRAARRSANATARATPTSRGGWATARSIAC